MSEHICPPKALRPWLEAKGSITQMAKAHARQVSLTLCHTGWDKDKEGVQSYRREIIMYCDESPWWYALTRMTLETYYKRESSFANLGENSLGCLLFSDKGIKRCSLSFYAIRPDNTLYQHAANYLSLSEERLWVREAEYDVSGAPLYLWEVFLPDMLTVLA